MSDQISHQQETTCKIIVLYVIIFIFLNSKLRDKNILLRMTASIPWIQSALNFLLKGILIR